MIRAVPVNTYSFAPSLSSHSGAIKVKDLVIEPNTVSYEYETEAPIEKSG
jgi:hypothetical protein